MRKNAKNEKPRLGRPSLNEAARLDGKILDAATHLFFAHGYGAASMEAVAKHARVSKRTLYDRYSRKPELFRAVVNRIIENLRLSSGRRNEAVGFEDALLALAKSMLAATLTPEALALNRLIIAEAGRFPELAQVMNEQGARRQAVQYIAGLLEGEMKAGRIRMGDAQFAAEQFIQLVFSLPQRRALGIGKPMTPREIAEWPAKTVALFLDGCRNHSK